MAPIQDNDNSSPGVTNPNRREFLLNAGSTISGGVIAACAPAYASSAAAPNTPEAVRQERSVSEGSVPITLRINSKDYSMRIDPRTTLLDCVRETVGLTGTKKGCDHGQCGACTVHVNGTRALSCLNLALMHDG